MENLSAAAVKQNAIVLSNAAALTAAIITTLGEKDVSKSMNGESLTRDQIENLALSKLTNSITTPTHA